MGQERPSTVGCLADSVADTVVLGPCNPACRWSWRSGRGFAGLLVVLNPASVMAMSARMPAGVADSRPLFGVGGAPRRVPARALVGARDATGVAYSESVVCRRPASLHDAEGEMRDTCALDHPGALQLDRLRALVEQPDAIPKKDRHQI